MRWPCADALGALALSTCAAAAQAAPATAASSPAPTASQSAEPPSATASDAAAAAQQRAARALNVIPDERAHAPYWVPALEILGFQVLLNPVNYWWGSGREDYRVTLNSIRTNLHSGWDTDDDPFQTNQPGHPVAGAIYHGIAR